MLTRVRVSKEIEYSWDCSVNGATDIAGAAEPKVRDGIRSFETAAESETHERGKIADVFGALRSRAAKELAFEASIATSVAGDHGGAEVRNPFPNDAVHIMEAVEIRLGSANGWEFWA